MGPLVYHQTQDVVCYQQVSKMGCALLRIRQVVVLEVGRRSGPGYGPELVAAQAWEGLQLSHDVL